MKLREAWEFIKACGHVEHCRGGIRCECQRVYDHAHAVLDAAVEAHEARQAPDYQEMRDRLETLERVTREEAGRG